MDFGVLHATKDYQVQNFPLDPLPNGRERREGGKFRPTPYNPDEDLSHLMSPSQFRHQFGDSFESSSVIDDHRPVNKIGTSNRRVYRRQSFDKRTKNKGTTPWLYPKQ